MSSSFSFASPGDLACDFNFFINPSNKEEFSKVIQIGATGHTYKLGNLYVEVIAEPPANSVLSKVFTKMNVAFVDEAVDGNQLASSKSVLVAEDDGNEMRPYVSFSKPSAVLKDETEVYGVQCSRLNK
jgi:hypothetical protein